MSADSYRVEQHPRGVLIYGGVPASEFTALVTAWKEHGLTIVDAGISSALGASWCVTSPEGSKLWRAEVDARAATVAGPDRELEWVLGADTGLSSLSLLLALGSSPDAAVRAINRLNAAGYQNGCAPSDADDFGRCVRLLAIFFGWRERLAGIGRPGPLLSAWLDAAPWYAIQESWLELEYLHRKTETGDDAASRRASAEFNRRMQELRSEA